jgi:anaerobic selenocysteine-containing dehydrogenase
MRMKGNKDKYNKSQDNSNDETSRNRLAGKSTSFPLGKAWLGLKPWSTLKYFINRKNVTNEEWEDFYRTRWQHDKEVRSTHGVNCTGSCSWRIFVKKGIVTWEMQQTDYPRTRPGLPNHEPRGCPRGASYSWYLYNSGRVKHPMIRRELLDLWDAAKKEYKDPVEAWGSIASDKAKMKLYKDVRGLGGFVRLDWDTALEIMAAANIWTIKRYGPGPSRRLHTYSRLLHAQLCLRCPLPQYARWCDAEFLRLSTVTCRQPLHRCGASRPMYPRVPTGTTPRSSCSGARMCQ